MGTKRGDYFAYVVDEDFIGIVTTDAVTAGFFGWKPVKIGLPPKAEDTDTDDDPTKQSVVIFAGIERAKGEKTDYVVVPLQLKGTTVYEIYLKSRVKPTAPKYTLEERRAKDSEQEALAVEQKARGVMTVRFPSKLRNSDSEFLRPITRKVRNSKGELKDKPSGMGITLGWFAKYLIEKADKKASEAVMGFKKRGGQLVQFRPDIIIEEAVGGKEGGKATILGGYSDPFQDNDVIDADFFEVQPGSNLALPVRRRLMLPEASNKMVDMAQAESLIPSRRR